MPNITQSSRLLGTVNIVFRLSLNDESTLSSEQIEDIKVQIDSDIKSQMDNGMREGELQVATDEQTLSGWWQAEQNTFVEEIPNEDIKSLLSIADQEYCGGELELTKPQIDLGFGGRGDGLAEFIRNEIIDCAGDDPIDKKVEDISAALNNARAQLLDVIDALEDSLESKPI